MKFQNNQNYCIHNTGNNFDKIFFNEGNKDYFRRKIKEFIEPFAEVIHISLLENQFAILIRTKDEIDLSMLPKNIGIMLGSYSRGVNIQQKRIGSLFRKGTKAFQHISDFPAYLKEFLKDFRDFFDPSKVVNFSKSVKRFYSILEKHLVKPIKKYEELNLEQVLVHPRWRLKKE